MNICMINDKHAVKDASSFETEKCDKDKSLKRARKTMKTKTLGKMDYGRIHDERGESAGKADNGSTGSVSNRGGS